MPTPKAMYSFPRTKNNWLILLRKLIRVFFSKLYETNEFYGLTIIELHGIFIWINLP
jgi:hypothetical protein